MKIIDQKYDVLKEIVSIGVGRAAGILNEMINMEIELDVPIVEMESLDDFKKGLQSLENIAISKITLVFHGGLEGFTELIVQNESAIKITSILTGEQIGSPDLEIAVEGTISEVGNILLNGVMGTFSNILELQLEYEPPTYEEEMLHDYSSADHISNVSFVLICKTKFSIDKINFDGQILILVKENFISILEEFLEKKM